MALGDLVAVAEKFGHERRGSFRDEIASRGVTPAEQLTPRSRSRFMTAPTTSRISTAAATELDQQVVELRRQLTEKDDDLDAARMTNPRTDGLA